MLENVSNSNKHLHSYSHMHGGLYKDIAISSQKGIFAIRWSLVGLFLTAFLQVIVVVFTGSVSLLADTIHNFADAFTAIPLWIAFRLERLKPTKRFTYGYGRIEDLAGVVIVFMMFVSAFYVGYESIYRMVYPNDVQHLWAVMLASIIGFVGNEFVAILRIKVGKKIGSSALIADGYHARSDGLTSLAVFFGAMGVWFGLPIADPIVGMIITVIIIKIAVQSAKEVFTRLLDGVNPEVVEEIAMIAGQTIGVQQVSEVRVRWIGHKLHAEVNIAVDPQLSVEMGHNIAKETMQHLLHHLNYLGSVTVHIDPVNAPGEKYHLTSQHCVQS